MSTNIAHNDSSLEKNYPNRTNPNNGVGNPYQTAEDESSEAALNNVRTATSVNMSPELFEKLYLSPENRVKGDLRRTFGNPTPVALVGFVLALTPLSCDLMGWRGAGGTGAASTGLYFFFGGLLMILGSIGEWILGNTFPCVVFGTFGAFFAAFAATLVPWFNAFGAYVADPTKPASAGLQTPTFNASFGFFFLFMGVICFIFLVCSLRTNVVFVVIFISVVLAFCCLTGAYWHLALVYANASNASAAATAGKLVKAAGGCFFVTSLAGWYIFFAIMLASVDFPLQIPVGDLSTVIKGASAKKLVDKSAV